MRRIRLVHGDLGGGAMRSAVGRGPVEFVAEPWLIEPARSAGRQIARIVGGDSAGGNTLAASVFAAPRTRLLLVAGVLLDLVVGEVLRRSGRTPSGPVDEATWVLPSVPLSTGMRCVHSPSTSAGAAVLWTSGLADIALPSPSDLPRLLDAGRPATDPMAVVQRMRLRLAGWTAPAYLVLGPDHGIRSVLFQLASLIVERVHEPLYARLGLPPIGPLRAVANRLIADFAVAAMLAIGRLWPLGPADVRRLVWTGPPVVGGPIAEGPGRLAGSGPNPPIVHRIGQGTVRCSA